MTLQFSVGLPFNIKSCTATRTYNNEHRLQCNESNSLILDHRGEENKI